MSEFTNLLQFQKHFSNELVCMQYLEQQLWNGQPVCPHCGSEHHYRTKTRLKHPDLKDYKDFLCKACNKKYSVLTGTIYESSKVSMQKWLAALYLLSTSKKGISSLHLSRYIGVSQRTAWFMLHRLREMLQEKAPEVIEGEVQVDESFVGGKNKNRHWDKKVKNSQGRSFKDKTPVFGMVANGKARCVVVPDTRAETIQPIIREHVARGSTIYSDEWSAYTGLNNDYDHQVVDHGRGQYCNGRATTNSVEGFWSILKRGIIGVYHYVSRKHLQRYCNEFVFRYNHRNFIDADKFRLALQNCVGVRLLYKALT